ncbi:hypothetical protein LCGC14_1692830 [marine sediment metagenome]|uniref:Sialidase domain-containing protein n=1 Tax=marine sediment metagenome TaxID=412755 RepID=A0A0F9I7W3_9ZZZZ
MADVAVETAADGNLNVQAIRLGPVWTDKDTGYLVFIDATFDVVYRKTTDAGVTWANAVLIDATSATCVDIWFDKWTPSDTGTIIHIWWMESATDLIHYRSLDTSDDSLGTDVTVFTGSTFDAAGRLQAVLSGTKAVGGNLYVQFWGDNDGEQDFYRSTDTGANWTNRLTGGDGNAADSVLCLPDDDSADNQDMVMIYWDRSADEISIKKYDNSADTWGETSISGSMVDNNQIMQMSAVVRHSDGHIIVAAWNSIDLTTSDLQVWDITLATPTITAKTDVVTNADDCLAAALFIDQNNDDLYCAYLGNEDGSQVLFTTVTAFYKKSTDGGGVWGSQAAYQEGTEDDEKYISAGHSTPGAAAGRFEPVFFNDDLNDLFVNKVNSVEITVGAAATRRYSLTTLGVG